MYKHRKVNIDEILLKYKFSKNVSNIFFFQGKKCLRIFFEHFQFGCTH